MHERNVKVFIYYKFFQNMMIIGPVLVLFFIWKGLDYTQMMLLQSISAISVIIFEVPTGAISDKVTRHLSLFLGCMFAALGLLIYIIGKTFLVFALAEIIFGLGITFTSGSDTSILYESLTALGRKKEYQSIMGKAMSAMFIGQGLGAIASSLLYTIHPLIPFLVSVMFLAVAMFASTFFIDHGRVKSEHNYLIHTLQCARLVITKKRIFWALGFAIAMGIAFRCSFWLYQPYFAVVKLDIAWYGVAFFLFNICAAFSARVLVPLLQEFRPRRILLLLLLVMSLSYIISAMHPHIIMIAIFALHQFVRGLYQPTMSFYINHQVEDHNRATVSSMVSMAGSLGFALFSPLMGHWLDTTGTINTYYRMGWLSFTSLIILFFLWRLHKQGKKRIASDR
ncbi:MAG: MFS transporter [Candidatus Cloacimonetes bacterium]|nr:MFS transporter [Candidatus Cloacimonadota bacterium]